MEAALASAKARGVAIGAHGAKLAEANRSKAVNVAQDLKIFIEGLRNKGIQTVREIAATLNKRGVATPQGKKWHSISAYRMLKRMTDDK